MSKPFFFINNEWVPATDACISVTDLAVQRGYGIFDFFKTVNGYPVFLDEHLDRFFHSAAQMHLPVGKTKAELKEIIFELLKRNELPDSGVRITLTGGSAPDGYTISTPNLLITQQPLQMLSEEAYSKGIRLITYAHQRQLPHIKTIDYLMAIWLQPVIKEYGADDVLYHQNGIITEGPRSNIFLVTEEGVLLTPARNILKGIIRSKVLKLASGNYQVEERDITVDELKKAKEVFITSTTKHLLKVTQIDEVDICKGQQPFPVMEQLQQELNKLIKQQTSLPAISL